MPECIESLFAQNRKCNWRCRGQAKNAHTMPEECVAKMKLWNNKWNRVYIFFFRRSIANGTWTYYMSLLCMCTTFPHHENSIQHKLLSLFFSPEFDFAAEDRRSITARGTPLVCHTHLTHAYPNQKWSVFFLHRLFLLCAWQAAAVRSTNLLVFAFYPITILLTSAKYNTEHFHLALPPSLQCACLCYVQFIPFHCLSQFEILVHSFVPSFAVLLVRSYLLHIRGIASARILLLFCLRFVFLLSINWLCKLEERGSQMWANFCIGDHKHNFNWWQH